MARCEHDVTERPVEGCYGLECAIARHIANTPLIAEPIEEWKAKQRAKGERQLAEWRENNRKITIDGKVYYHGHRRFNTGNWECGYAIGKTRLEADLVLDDLERRAIVATGVHLPCTYFLYRNSRIRISRTSQIIDRIFKHQETIDGAFTLMDIIWDASREGFLHKRFAADRRRGEWFRDTPDLRAYIREHAASDGATTKLIGALNADGMRYRSRKDRVLPRGSNGNGAVPARDPVQMELPLDDYVY